MIFLILHGQTWNKGLSYTNKVSRIPLNEILKENTNFGSHNLKLRLIAEGLKEYKCEKCGNEGEWMGEPITLELHHINGNHYDNRLENLQILCPNCHSQTPKHKGKKYTDANTPKPQKRKKYECICEICGKTFKTDRERRFCSRECYNTFLNKNKNGNLLNEEALKEAITKAKTITELSKMFNTSTPTIRKYLNKYNLLDVFKETYSDPTRSKKIIQYDLNMNPIKEWGSISDAEETLGIFSIDKCAMLKRKTARWLYMEIC